jgi:diguanylate cyclase (GGDEF)-like protein
MTGPGSGDRASAISGDASARSGDRRLRRQPGPDRQAGDAVARFGGDEFVVLCPETTDRGLMALSDDLEETLRRNRIEASVGFTQREPSDSSPQDLVARADAAMYRQKRESTAHAKALATAEA